MNAIIHLIYYAVLIFAPPGKHFMSSPLSSPLPSGLWGLSRAGKDVSSYDVWKEWQAIPVREETAHYTDCFVVFLGSQGHCHLSSVWPQPERALLLILELRLDISELTHFIVDSVSFRDSLLRGCKGGLPTPTPNNASNGRETGTF